MVIREVMGDCWNGSLSTSDVLPDALKTDSMVPISLSSLAYPAIFLKSTLVKQKNTVLL